MPEEAPRRCSTALPTGSFPFPQDQLPTAVELSLQRGWLTPSQRHLLFVKAPLRRPAKTRLCRSLRCSVSNLCDDLSPRQSLSFGASPTARPCYFCFGRRSPHKSNRPAACVHEFNWPFTGTDFCCKVFGNSDFRHASILLLAFYICGFYGASPVKKVPDPKRVKRGNRLTQIAQIWWLAPSSSQLKSLLSAGRPLRKCRWPTGPRGKVRPGSIMEAGRANGLDEKRTPVHFRYMRLTSRASSSDSRQREASRDFSIRG